jgi:hypothetical protein
VSLQVTFYKQGVSLLPSLILAGAVCLTKVGAPPSYHNGPTKKSPLGGTMAIHSLPCNLMVAVLSYLRATDLMSLCSTNPTLFSKHVVSDSILIQLNNVYSKFYQYKSSSSLPGQLYRPQHLFNAEYRAVLAALQVSQLSGSESGYFISSAWHSQAKKYFEAIRFPDVSPGSCSPAIGSGSGEPTAVSLSAPSPSRPAAPIIFSTPPSKKSKGRTPQPRGSPANRVSTPNPSTPNLGAYSLTPTLSQTTSCGRPGESMTADLLCCHGNLVPQHKLSKFRRRQVESRVYHFLHRFFPSGPTFRANVKECSLCVAAGEEMKSQLPSKQTSSSGKSRPASIYILPEGLEAVFNRKTGVPSQCVAFTNGNNGFPSTGDSHYSSMHNSRYTAESVHSYSEYEADDLELALAMSISLSGNGEENDFGLQSEGFEDSIVDELATASSGSSTSSSSSTRSSLIHSVQPLVPGIYHMVPRAWLRLWRQAVKTQNGSMHQQTSGIAELNGLLPSIDYTSLLCSIHGHFVIPPHLEEYLRGSRRQLLGQLGSYQGETVEVVSGEEWDLLQQSMKALNNCRVHLGSVVGDYEVIFSLDGEHVDYSTTICRKCDPFNYVTAAPGRRKGPNHNPSKRK